MRLQLTAEAQRWGHYLLIRRSLSTPDELAYCVVYAPRDWVSPEKLARVAGQCWKIEQGFQTAKGECGLDEYEVRRWGSWYRHITFSLLAHALLVAIRQATRQSQKKTKGKIGWTLSELKQLIGKGLWKGSQTLSHALHWSDWRRKHQYKAWQCHCQQ